MFLKNLCLVLILLMTLKKKTALPHAGRFPEQSGRVPKGIFAVQGGCARLRLHHPGMS
jgi:hypothetical protein